MRIRIVALFFIASGIGGMVLPAFTQGICIPTPIKASVVEGHVFWKGNGKPMSAVRVELFAFDSQKRLADVMTDADGFFTIDPPRNGKYRLSAKDERLGGLSVELRLEKKSQPKTGKRDHIHFLIDLEPGRYCSGSSVFLTRD